jgi:hypothetical protein
LSLISDDDALPRGGPGREALNAYQSLTFTPKGTVYHLFAVAECRGWLWESVPRWGLRGNGPALTGNVGAS